ncbi:MAG: hypothetical protein HC824_20520 [Synechococcales cyanobacterium RM1_1_8]|nr:hypothetical protein [Synechococcales cyanobacterium RM1_1_8]
MATESGTEASGAGASTAILAAARNSPETGASIAPKAGVNDSAIAEDRA